MKKQTFTLITLSLVMGLSFTSCKKEGCTDSTATNYNSSATSDDGSCTYDTPTAAAPGSYTPSFDGEFAGLIAIKTVTTTTLPVVGDIDVEFGTGVAVFSSDGGNSYVSAGTVTLDGLGLTMQTNNTYVHQPEPTDADGIQFGSTVNWSGTGATWNSFNASTSQGFCSISQITSGDVTTSSSYVLEANTVSNADSILFAVHGPSGSKTIIVAGTNSSHTFSASDLSGVGTGTGFVQIVGINYDPQTISSKQYYLINETVRTKQVTIN